MAAPILTLSHRMLRISALAAGSASAGWALTSSGYLLALAAVRRPREDVPPRHDLALTILIPAHDEADRISAAVSSALACDYPPALRRVIVIADNCTDSTAELARNAGVEAWERDQPDARGKGQALAWSLRRLEQERARGDAVVFIDADCTVSSNLLATLAGRLAAGYDGAQARYAIANSRDGSAEALRAAGFALMNFTRPRGKQALGFSCGLLGTGMALSTKTLDAVPWKSFSLTEDREYHLNLVEAGRRIGFAGEAEVLTLAPPTRAGAETQETRWDAGNLQLARHWIPRLLRQAGRGRAHRLHAAFELAVPPQSLLSALCSISVIAAAIARSPRLFVAGQIAAGWQAAYVVAGLLGARVPGSVWLALPRGPLLVVRRLLQLRRVAGGSAMSWERTERTGGGAATQLRAS